MANSPSFPPKNLPIAISDWPMSLETTRAELQKARNRLERYQAALRLANVEIEQRNRYIIALTTFAYQASRTATIGALLRLTLVQALETTGASVGAVILFDAKTKALTLGIHRGLSAPLTQILTGQELDKGATALMPHVVAGEGALLEYNTSDDPQERLLLASGCLSSLVSLPLHVGARLIGTLMVGLQDKRLFKPSELCFLMSLAQEAAIVLDSLHLRDELWHTAETLLGEELPAVRLEEIEPDGLNLESSLPLDLTDTGPAMPQPAQEDLEQLLAAMMEAEQEVRQQNADLQTLNTIAELINQTLDLREILGCAVEQTRQTLQTDAAWIYLINEANQLELQAHTGLSEAYTRGMQSLSLSSSLEGQVAIENKAVYIEDLSTDPRSHKIWVDKEGLQAIALVPLTTPDLKVEREPQVIGVLAVGMRKRSGAKPTDNNYIWNPREIRLLTSIANQMALAINNARLYAQIQDNEINVRTGNEVLQTINDMLLEKIAFLERFIGEELDSNLTQASKLLDQLLPKLSPHLTDSDRRDLAMLQEIIKELRQQAQEVNVISTALDTEFNQTFDQPEKKTDYAKSTKPLRLEKIGQNPLPPATNQKPEAPEQPKERDIPSNRPQAEGSGLGQQGPPRKSMSFEEAVAAGLVPSHIINRENKQSTKDSD